MTKKSEARVPFAGGRPIRAAEIAETLRTIERIFPGMMTAMAGGDADARASNRMEQRWTRRRVSSSQTFHVLVYAISQLQSLTEYERDDGTVTLFKDPLGRIVHVVTMLANDEWACFCSKAIDGECEATTYCRVRVEEETDG